MEKVGMVIVGGFALWTLRDIYIYYFRRPDDRTAELVEESGKIEALAEECVADMPLDQVRGVVQAVEVPTEVGVGVNPNDPEVVPAAEEPYPIKDSTPRLEVRERRGVIGEDRPVYIRKVLDECKAKFGTPKVTEANHKAVWHYAHGLMKNHGVRPSHRAEMLPYVVQMTFVESAAELRAGVTVGAYRALLHNKFDEHLSRVERWSRKLWRSTGLA